MKQLLLILIFSTAILGCGGPAADYSKVDLVKGEGTVTLDGNPLPSAVITFEDPTDDTYSYAMTDAKGYYKLKFDSEMDGVKTGSKVVRISTTRKILGLNSAPGEEGEDADPDAPKKGELVPDRYNKNSELTAEVTSSSGRFDFDLKSK